jgi:hypothetical protein
VGGDSGDSGSDYSGDGVVNMIENPIPDLEEVISLYQNYQLTRALIKKTK